MDLGDLKYGSDGLVTVVAQDRLTGELRMLAHANREALQRTLDTGLAHFYSRSRGALWQKGEESGNSMAVSEVWADCDGDALVYLVEPAGPSCHTGKPACFFQRVHGDGRVDSPGEHAQALLPKLFRELSARQQQGGDSSYTKKLLDAGAAKIGDKVREEADELARALVDESDDRVVSEAGDVIYHLLVGLLSRGVSLRDVESELARRFGTSGLDEKASRE